MNGRIRTVKPELWDSPDFIALNGIGKLAFLALMTKLADDEGRAHTDARHIVDVAHLRCPATRVEEQLDLMERRGMLNRYDSHGVGFMAIVNFTSHQRIDRPTASKLPPPPINEIEYGNSREVANDREGSTLARVRSLTVRSTTVDSQESLLTSEQVTARDPVGEVFAAWQQSTGHADARLISSRRAKIAARLKEFPLADVLDAVQGWVNDPWEERPLHNELEVLLRNGAQVEKFRDLWRNGKPVITSTNKTDIRVRRLMAGEIG